jgi:hypothetical protein
MRTARFAVVLQPLLNPCVDAVDGISDEPALGGASDDLLEGHAGYNGIFDAGVEKLAIPTVAENEAVVRIVDRKPFGDALERLKELSPAWA